MNYEQLAKKLVARARKRGARQAEAYIEISRESSCRVRDGEIEDMTQATSRGVVVRVIAKNRLGFAYTSDFEEGSLNSFVDRALELAAAAAPNALNGLPTRADLEHREAVADLFDPAVAQLSGDWKLKTSLEMEKAAKAFD
ncbi:MAG TPA: DNA gyrase modulator, partial [Myxococcaceae bacterium]|nr:DNA gyrase modulator [Myxococcaceae bacterium]